MNPNDWKLIALAFAAIGALVFFVTRLKVNAFIALVLASLIVGAGAVLQHRVLKGPTGDVAYSMVGVGKSFQEGLGATLGGTAAVVALGVMLGKFLGESGGAEVLAKRFAAFFGAERIQWCIMALALAVGLTTWFAVGLVLLLPILLTLTRETKQPFLRLTLPLLACLSVMHGVMPPHPGPVVAVEAFKANNGWVLLWGFVIGIPTAAVAGPIFAKWAVKNVKAETPKFERQIKELPAHFREPGFGLTLFSILLPVILMLLETITKLVLKPGDPFREFAAFLGAPTMALTVAVLFGTWSLGANCGYKISQMLKFTEQAVGSVGLTILVIGAGGGFARVLRDCGVAESIGRLGEMAHLSPLLYGWMVSAFIRVATGSATVAITTASGLLVPVLAQHPEYNDHQKALIITAIGCGSLFLSHLNDSGFWMVKDCLGLTVQQTMRTWTICETLVGLVGMLLSLLAFQFV